MDKVIVTREGFGRCLKAGLECKIIGQKGEAVVIQLLNGDVWHGQINELEVLDDDISHLIPLRQVADHEQRLVESISKLIRTGKIDVLKVD